MRITSKILLQVVSITVLAEAAYWITSDIIRFNGKTLNTNLEFLYYTLPALVALVLTLVVSFRFNKLHHFVSNLALVLINTYGFLCIILLTSGYCDLRKNLNVFYSAIVTIILISIACLLIKRVIPNMPIRNIAVLAITTIFAIYDFIFLLMGYRIFYPGNW